MYQVVDNFAAKTNLAFSSIVVCQCKFDERNIGLRFSSYLNHGAMIPLPPKYTYMNIQN
jgi:hypothetical protein